MAESGTSTEDVKDRVPPGQHLTNGFPVLHAGDVPKIDLAQWDFQVGGLVENPMLWTYDAFMSLPQIRIHCDIHCVTGWSKLDNDWDGIPFGHIVEIVKPKPEARFALVLAENGFTTNVPLEDLMHENVLFAHKHNGEPLTPDHGWPLRLVVPHLYFWKSAKWVRGLNFMAEDRAGFWEQEGYHMYGDPWKEQRFWYD